jgi:hypothetical protein
MILPNDRSQCHLAITLIALECVSVLVYHLSAGTLLYDFSVLLEASKR